MKIWIDDIRKPPSDYDCLHRDMWFKSVNGAKIGIECAEEKGIVIEVIDIDHDAGEYADRGNDYIRLLDWLEETGRSYPIHIHSMNPVGVANMRAIIERNGWVEV